MTGQSEARKPPGLYLLVVFLPGLASVLLYEAISRWIGWAPGHQTADPDLSSAFLFDPHLGWKNNPGRTFPSGPEAGRKPPVYTHLTDGTRATAEVSTERKKRILIAGASYTYGWGLDDEKTLPWKLQQRIQSHTIINASVPGYSTYQSLLALRRYYSSGAKSDIVLYGLSALWLTSNGSVADWLREMHTYSVGNVSRRIMMPYARLNTKGTLDEHEPTGFPELPLERHSAIVFQLQYLYALLTLGRPTTLENVRLSLRLIFELHQLAEKNGSRFALLVLNDLGHYGEPVSEFFKAHKIRVLRCALSNSLPDHPTGAMNEQLTHCTETQLKQQFRVR